MSKQERLERMHTRGQEDAAKGWGNYDPPNGVIRESLVEEAHAQNEAYRDGYANGVEQRPKS